jgi:hypothetical protein
MFHRKFTPADCLTATNVTHGLVRMMQYPAMQLLTRANCCVVDVRDFPLD